MCSISLKYEDISFETPFWKAGNISFSRFPALSTLPAIQQNIGMNG